MSKLPSGFLKDFFSYSRSERVGIVTLLIILLAVILIPSFFPDKKRNSINDLEDLKNRVDKFEQELADQLVNELKMKEPFAFDPNSADSLDFLRLDFTPAQTAVILRYRNKGGVFRTTEDFGQIYVVSDSVFARLKPFININKPKIKLVEINSAGSAELVQLSGIGEYYAKKIIDRRNKLGGFFSAEQLLEINGIDEERLNLFKEQIQIDTSLIKKIDINTVKINELRKHPYFDTKTVNAIVKYHKTKGQILSINHFVETGIITTQQAAKINVYIRY
ncbi:MAG: helix-hairpin-helix domain-containing protein [Prevotellaceae bacterium]|jgi:competence ComEA-like helix-hairpin-helix protein|nr:helix-hairpin-helix domain-containing protein [Prevotellaceae bacterium]